MIVSNIIGGLGNQMFQHACGFAMSKRLGTEYRWATDMFEDYPLHNGFDLTRVFGLRHSEASSSDLRRLIGWRQPRKIRLLLGRPKCRHFWGGKASIDCNTGYASEMVSGNPDRYLHGYWQSELYFEDFSSDIRTEFQFTIDWRDEDLAIIQSMSRVTSVSVHIRKGDYLSDKNKGIYANCSVDYYMGAMLWLKERFPDVVFYVFSDDPVWVRQNITVTGSKVVVVSHNVGDFSFADMRLMAQAKHHIIANSTFGWWGAWLNARSDKIVIAPSKWYANRRDMDVIPAAWLRM